jgi:hypothetical protein
MSGSVVTRTLLLATGLTTAGALPIVLPVPPASPAQAGEAGHWLQRLMRGAASLAPVIHQE